MKSGGRSYVDIYEAVRHDVHLHGVRFIFLEFAAATLIAAALAIFELLRADSSWSSLLAGFWFAGFAANSLAVVLLAKRAARFGTSTRVRQRWLHLYALELLALLLIPGAVALVARLQWHTGDLSARPNRPDDPTTGHAP
jgi:hypothetical protein